MHAFNCDFPYFFFLCMVDMSDNGCLVYFVRCFLYYNNWFSRYNTLFTITCSFCNFIVRIHVVFILHDKETRRFIYSIAYFTLILILLNFYRSDIDCLGSYCIKMMVCLNCWDKPSMIHVIVYPYCFVCDCVPTLYLNLPVRPFVWFVINFMSLY